MAQTNINISMDESLKHDFDNLCSDLGLTMATAFNIFAKTVVRRQGIPFEISRNIPNEETISAIEEIQEMKKNAHLNMGFNSVEALFEELNRND